MTQHSMSLPNNLEEGKADYMNRVLSRFIKLPDILDFVLVSYHCEIPIETCIEYLEVFEKKLNTWSNQS